MFRRIAIAACLAATSLPAQSLLARPRADGAAWVRNTMAKLTLEQRIAQLITADLSGWYTSTDDPRASWWISLARDHGIGSFVFTGGTPRDVAAALNGLQKVARVPLLIAADVDAGMGHQVNGATEFPAAMAFAAAGDTLLMERAAQVIAFEGRAMGVHLAYGPSVDFTARAGNPGESVKSFGGDLQLTAALTRTYVRGLHANGMLATARNWPGRGDVTMMPGMGLPWNGKPTGQVIRQDLEPFRQAIQAGVDVIMSDHLPVPSLARTELPTTIERRIARDWLRDSLGFRGLLITGDLSAPVVATRFAEVDLAVRAFEAGHDMFLRVRNPLAVIRGLADAVRSGRIARARVDSAAAAVLTLKARLNLHRARLVPEARLADRVGILDHWKLAGEVADRSVTLLRRTGVFPVDSSVKRVVNVSIAKSPTDPSPGNFTNRLELALPSVTGFTLRDDMDSVALAEVADSVRAADLVIFSLFVSRDRYGPPSPLHPSEIAFIERAANERPGRVVVMSFGNPYHVTQLPSVPAFLVGYSERGTAGNQEIYYGSFMRALRGQLELTGRLPVRVSDEFPVGFGIMMTRKAVAAPPPKAPR